MTAPDSDDAASRLRVLVLASTYPRWANDHEPGFVHELSRRLASAMDVMVLAPHAPGARCEEDLDGVRVWRYRYAPPSLETLVNDGGIVANLKRSPWKWLLVPCFVLAQAWAVYRAMRRFSPDVVHAHWLIPQGLVVAVLSKLLPMPPMLVTSHGADLFALNAAPLRSLKRFVIRAAARMTVVSSGMKDALTDLGAPSDRVDVLSMGVDLSQRFVADAKTVRSDAGLLFVGRLVEKKGLRHLIAAMPAIVRACPRARLTIAGFGPEEAMLRRQTAALGMPPGSIEFIGAVTQEQLPRLYREAAVFVAPFVQAASGDREGLGLVLVEALGCGCPAIVSDLPATREVLADRPQPLRVAPGDPDAIAAAAIHLLAEGRDAARDSVRESLPALRGRFDWKSVAAGYSQLLRNIAAKI
jgi:glycosyltransferase involved in cell wall biosynthesis